MLVISAQNDFFAYESECLERIFVHKGVVVTTQKYFYSEVSAR